MDIDALIEDHGYRLRDLEESRVDVSSKVAEIQANLSDAREDIRDMRGEMKEIKADLKESFDNFSKKMDDFSVQIKPKRWFNNPQVWAAGGIGVTGLTLLFDLGHKIIDALLK
jgi:hypothetical protein